MADRGAYGLSPRLDIEQLLLEAQHRWLRPAEICEILRNHQKFQIASEPPTRPPSGSLFLFDRKVLRYFRKDGHKWRKKKDGKTVKEAHEKLKVGSIDVLHCYYAHGEENENFQRRSYWMLEPDLMHIVFVHYLEVKGGRTIAGVRESSEGSLLSSGCSGSHIEAPSGNTDSASPTSTLTSLCEDADSEDSHQASSKFHSSMQLGNASVLGKIDSIYLNPYLSQTFSGGSTISGVNDVVGSIDYNSQMVGSQRTLNSASLGVGVEQYMLGYSHVSSPSPITLVQSDATETMLDPENKLRGELSEFSGTAGKRLETSQPMQSNWQNLLGNSSFDLAKWPMDPASSYELTNYTGLIEPKSHDMHNVPEPFGDIDLQRKQPLQNNFQMQYANANCESSIKSTPENDVHMEGNMNYTLPLKKSLLEGEESLKKVDSFSRWVSKELGEVDDLQMQSSSAISWSTVECENVTDDSSLSPSISQDQLFSIIDYSPKWAYTDSEPEVLIIGTFLKSHQDVAKYNWSCMFGEIEVPAVVLANGILSCSAPSHRVEQVPFYVTCSNRLACSEVREFDYRVGSKEDVNILDIYDVTSCEIMFHLRLEKLLSVRSVNYPSHHYGDVAEKRDLISKIIMMKEEEECCLAVEPSCNQELSQNEEKGQFLQNLMKEKLYSWLLHKVTENGKGPNVVDEKGQGVIHLVAALSYNWALKPVITAEVSVNFRDVNGWTALHWAAYCGREQTVAILLSLGAAPGALTDPSTESPLGITPADLASSNGHKGISGFLAEASLTSHLYSLTMNDSKEDGSLELGAGQTVQTVSDRRLTFVNDNNVQDVSLRDSLNAVCNATQAADRIHQMFRMQSFQQKQLAEYSCDALDEHAILLAAANMSRPSSDGLAHAAATHIQKRYRGWKKRKEFLLIRQRIVKIQAHVRGHQVRKQYKSIIWSVGILEKVILRWRRKGSGLRGFRRDAITKESEPGNFSSNEDDYDFLKEGRKQSEERRQKALARVKSMVQYPEGRAQYRRLLTVVEEIRETKGHNVAFSNSETTVNGDEDLIDIDSLLDDDTFMSIAFD